MFQKRSTPPGEGGVGNTALAGCVFPTHTEFDAQAQIISARYGISDPHARLIVRLLRGGAA